MIICSFCDTVNDGNTKDRTFTTRTEKSVAICSVCIQDAMAQLIMVGKAGFQLDVNGLRIRVEPTLRLDPIAKDKS